MWGTVFFPPKEVKMGWSRVASSASRKKNHLLDGFDGGRNPLGRYFWDPGLGNYKKQKYQKKLTGSLHILVMFLRLCEKAFLH